MTLKTNDPGLELLIEEFAVRMELFGLPKLAAKLHAAMILAEPPEKSTADLMRLTGGSKGAISQMLRLLDHFGMVERCAAPGKRGHRYRLPKNFMLEMFQQKMNAVLGMRDFLHSFKEDLENTNEYARQNIEEMMLFHQFFYDEVIKAFDRWKEQRQKRANAGNRGTP